MSPIEVKPVLSHAEKNILVAFPWRIYKDDPLWVPPLISERKKSIDPSRGVWFEQGTADFFIAWRDGQPVGTICAAEDKKGNAAVGRHDCVFGFFDLIDDYEVAVAMLERAARWARERRLETLLGPFNLDYEDAYGILIEGRDRPPAILCGHTPVYYQGFMERYGFKAARGDNLAYEIDVSESSPVLPRLYRMANLVRSRKDFTIRPADFTHWRDEVDRVLELINPCLQHLTGFIPWTRENLQKLMEPFVEIADPQLILFAEKNGKPIGFFPAVPNMNEVLIHLNGLRYPWDNLKALWYSRQKSKSASIKSVLVLPEYWGSGAIILLMEEMANRLIERGYNWADLSLTSDDNPNTPILAEHMGAKIYKRYRVYRKPI
jgi:GNAT superfamily N-acetyltransferase